MLSIRVTILLLVLATLAVGSERRTAIPGLDVGGIASQEEYDCRTNDMPVSWKTDGQPLKILRNGAVFYEVGSAAPDLEVLNTETSTITGIALVLEYEDKEGHRIYTATVAGTQKGLEKGLPVPFAVENMTNWETQFDPGKTVRLRGWMNGNRTVTCPVAAKITFAMTRFRNGVIRQYSSAGWSVPPIPKLVPGLSLPCPAVQNAPIEIPGKMRISASGEVVAVNAASIYNVSVWSWGAAQVRAWKFHPAVVNGEPKEWDLDVEFVFYGSSNPDFKALSPSLPAVLIQFFPSSEDSSPHCVEAFAQATEGTTIP